MAAQAPWANQIVGYGEEPPESLLAHPMNPKIHPKHQQDALSGSLSELGWIAPVIVNRTTAHVLDGHARIGLAISRGEPLVPIAYVEISPEQEALALAIYDPIGAMAVTDAAALSSLLDEVSTGDAALRAMLSDLAESAGILNGAGSGAEDPGARIDRAEELRRKWGTERGQLWEIGDHRLAIGDCTDAQVIAALMQGETAGAVVTDPPYGIDQPGIENDNPECLPVLFAGCLRAMPAKDAVVIAFQSTRMFPTWLDAVRAAGHHFERMLWMYKPNDVTFPWRGWLLTSEAILVSTVGEPVWLRVDPFAHDCYTSNWDSETKAKIDGWHASIKPLPLVQDLVARVGGLVYEPFSGSGTTMVACERLGRPCRAVELTPGYAAISIERLSGMGLTPRLADG